MPLIQVCKTFAVHPQGAPAYRITTTAAVESNDVEVMLQTLGTSGVIFETTEDIDEFVQQLRSAQCLPG